MLAEYMIFAAAPIIFTNNLSLLISGLTPHFRNRHFERPFTKCPYIPCAATEKSILGVCIYR